MVPGQFQKFYTSEIRKKNLTIRIYSPRNSFTSGWVSKKATWIPLFARHMCLLMSNHRHQLRKTNWKPSATARLQCYLQALELLIVFLLSWGHAPCHQMSISVGGISAKPRGQLNGDLLEESGKHLPENWHRYQKLPFLRGIAFSFQIIILGIHV